MTDTPKLLPCPFCGEGKNLGYDATQDAIMCFDCLCAGPEHASQQQSIAAWNRRHDAAVSAARKEGWDADLISEQRIKYESVAARVSVGKASQQEACDAIVALCRDNERLAVIAGRWRKDAASLDILRDMLLDMLWALDNAAAILSAHGLESTMADPRPAARKWIAETTP
jgi:hypothetical protein